MEVEFKHGFVLVEVYSATQGQNESKDIGCFSVDM